MIGEMIRVTARQLLGRRRTVLLVLLAAVPLIPAVAFRASGADTGSIGGDRAFIESVFDGLGVTLLLPLVALLLGTAVFGSDIEDGTALFVLAKPVTRWRIVLAKLFVACAGTGILAAGSAVVTGIVALGGVPDAEQVVVGYAVGTLAGGVVYSALFLALSLVTSRSLIVGLVYVILWEGVLANFFSGIRVLSVRQYALGIADAAGVNGRITPDTLAGTSALALALLVTAAAMLLAIRRLQAFEVPQAD